MSEETLPLFGLQFLKSETIIIALTGPLSSGCSTLADYLKEKGFSSIRLSDIIRNELKEKSHVENPTPQELQDKGDELRRTRGNSVLVELAIKELEKEKPEKIVIDGIRNPGEIKHLRKFPGFFLIAIDALRDERLKRYRVKAGELTPDQDFFSVDERDSGRNQPDYGQNVSMCVDLADFQIINNQSWDDDLTIKQKFFKKVELLLNLVKNPGSKSPSPEEIGMHLAYSASLMSPCLKRQVGAMIARQIDDGKELSIAIGYNRPPDGIKPCLEKYGSCYRDVLKKRIQEKFMKEMGSEGCEGIAESILQSFLSEPEFKQLDYCQSIHAEESAILQIAKLGGTSLSGTTLYTTTFPCIMCAKKIIQTGISKIVYNEAYPIIQARDLLAKALGEENLIRFEGIRSLSFFKLFQPNRIYRG